MSAVVHELTTGDMGKEETRVVANSNAKGEKAWIDSVSYRDARPNGGLTLHIGLQVEMSLIGFHRASYW